jgi:organic hydroperoxide reductase OsmC/OhrA
MEIQHEYQVALTWESDRKGKLTASEIEQSFEVATPPQFPKGMPGIWSPEHLFTAAVSSCLMTTFLAIAENSKLSFSAFSCKAFGKLEQIEGKYIMSEVTLFPVLTIFSEAERDRAMRVLQKSEVACLISNSIKSKINFQPEINVSLCEPVA